MHFEFKKKNESCGLCDFLIINLSMVSTNKRIKDKKCCVYNIFTILFQQILGDKLLLVLI